MRKKGPSGDVFAEIGKQLSLPHAQVMWAKAFDVHPLGVTVIEGRGYLNSLGMSEKLSKALAFTKFEIVELDCKCLEVNEQTEIVGYECTIKLQSLDDKQRQKIVKEEGWATFADSMVSRYVGDKNKPQRSLAILKMHARTRAVLRAYRRVCEVLGSPIIGPLAEEMDTFSFAPEIVGEIIEQEKTKAIEEKKQAIISEIKKIDNDLDLAKYINKHMNEWKKELSKEDIAEIEEKIKERVIELKSQGSLPLQK